MGAAGDLAAWSGLRLATPYFLGRYNQLKVAQYGTASHVEKVVGKYKSVQTSDEAAKEANQDNERKLVYYQDRDGLWIIHAELPPGDPLVVEVLLTPPRQISQKRHQQAYRLNG